MKWDDKAKAAAEANYGTPANTTYIAFLRGVLWQRDQTRAPETIECLAIGLLAFAANLTFKQAKADWAAMHEYRKEQYRDSAMHLMDPILGD